MTEKGLQDIIFIIIIIDCCLILYGDFKNTPTTKDWLVLLILEFCAQFLFKNLTNKQ